MKTEIRTFIGIAALGLIGFININATGDDKREVKANVASDKEVVLTKESKTVENESRVSKAELENKDAEKTLAVESWMTGEEFLKLAESYTASGADREIEKYSNKQVSLEQNRKQK
jgi:hypothetical protein